MYKFIIIFVIDQYIIFYRTFFPYSLIVFTIIIENIKMKHHTIKHFYCKEYIYIYIFSILINTTRSKSLNIK
jgi:hypothetical protein